MRREQILDAAKEHCMSDSVSVENTAVAYLDFIKGAEWADMHPTTTLLQPIHEHLKEVMKCLNKIYDMELETDACSELYFATNHLEEAMEDLELLIEVEE